VASVLPDEGGGELSAGAAGAGAPVVSGALDGGAAVLSVTVGVGVEVVSDIQVCRSWL